jgi:GNAT superfamily N-acetyltransferase
MMQAKPELFQATTPAQLEDARTLMRAFVAWSREAQVDNLHLLDLYFDPDAYERSLAMLPAESGPPSGSLVVAYVEGRPAGCVAMRDLGEGVCEMKRMYIADEFRGQGLGRALAERIIADARAAGYARMRLETSIRQPEAIRLYEGVGFRRIPHYNAAPPAMEHWLLAFELELRRRL